jgi:hypothetical protein
VKGILIRCERHFDKPRPRRQLWNYSLTNAVVNNEIQDVLTGRIMKKSYLTVVLTLTCLLGLSGGARAQDASRIVVNVPFDFVAGGETLPAGMYSVSRVSTEAQPDLVIRSDDKSALLLPIVFDGVPAEQAKLGFEHVGDRYFLSTVETLAGVYRIGIPRAMTRVAQMKDHGAMPSSGTN